MNWDPISKVEQISCSAQKWLHKKEANNMTKIISNWNRRIMPTYYPAESFSWYSLDLPKHICSPSSAQSLFIIPTSSCVSSPSSTLPANANSCLTSSCLNFEEKLTVNYMGWFELPLLIKTFLTNKVNEKTLLKGTLTGVSNIPACNKPIWISGHGNKP